MIIEDIEEASLEMDINIHRKAMMMLMLLVHRSHSYRHVEHFINKKNQIDSLAEALSIKMTNLDKNIEIQRVADEENLRR